MKKLVRQTGIAGAVCAGSVGMFLGIGPGVADAAPPSPAGSGMDPAQDRGRGHGWHDDRGWRGHDRDWNNDGRPSGLYINLPCVTGPYGVVTWCP
ncbi:hypothetical protein ACWDUN_10060 [Mycobacterium sp. NPDC003323]